jgi:hypothetical protein
MFTPVENVCIMIWELYFFFFSFLGWCETVHLVRRQLIGLLYQPRMIDDECGAVGRMRIGKGNRSTRRKPASVPLYPPQIPHDLAWVRTRAAAVGTWRLAARAMARPSRFVLALMGWCWKPLRFMADIEPSHPSLDTHVIWNSTISQIKFNTGIKMLFYEFFNFVIDCKNA